MWDHWSIPSGLEVNRRGVPGLGRFGGGSKGVYGITSSLLAFGKSAQRPRLVCDFGSVHTNSSGSVVFFYLYRRLSPHRNHCSYFAADKPHYPHTYPVEEHIRQNDMVINSLLGIHCIEKTSEYGRVCWSINFIEIHLNLIDQPYGWKNEQIN